MRESFLILVCFLGFCASNLPAQEIGGAPSPRRDELLQKIRERIIWYDQEKINPLLIPEDMVGLVAVEELPIPEMARGAIRQRISLQKERISASGEAYSECAYPEIAKDRMKSSGKQITLEEAMAKSVTSLLVSVDSTTRGLWPQQGVYQYNEVTPLQLLIGSKLRQDPLLTRAFLSEGGQIVIEGTVLCSKSPWHKEAPRKGDIYLLVGSPETDGIFYAKFYFRIEEGNIVPAAYPELKQADEPVSLNQMVAGASKRRDHHE